VDDALTRAGARDEDEDDDEDWDDDEDEDDDEEWGRRQGLGTTMGAAHVCIQRRETGHLHCDGVLVAQNQSAK
jgi:hypothetical protein